MKLLVAESLYCAEKYVEVFNLSKDEWRVGEFTRPFVANQFEQIVVIVPSGQMLTKDWYTKMEALRSLMAPGGEPILI